MITEIEKLLEAKEIELNMVHEQCESLSKALKKAGDTAPRTKHFWETHSALCKWQEVARSEYRELNSMLEKAKDVQAKLDQLKK